MTLSVGQVESVLLYSGIERQPIEAQEGNGIAANAWYKGDLVQFTSNPNDDGMVDVVAATGKIGGIAGDTCTGVDYAKFDLFLIDPAAIYLMRVENGAVSTRDYVGIAYGLNFDLGLQRVDINDVTFVDIYIVGIHPSDVGDDNAGINEGRVLVRFNYDIFTGILNV